MNRSVIILTVLMTALHGCDAERGSGHAPPAPAPQQQEQLPLDSVARMLHGNLVSIERTGLRFDGFYRWDAQDRHQLMRFYPQGFVVMVNGIDSTEGCSELRQYIDPRQGSKPHVGYHNVPVIAAGDSIYMVTPSDRGSIDYRGRIVRPDSLSIYKYSHIQGGKAVLGYVFQADR